MKTVVRVEYSNGTGMFRQDFFDEYHLINVAPEVSERHQNFNTPREDGLNISQDGKEWFCAYKSIEQFKQWVKDYEVRALIEAGYKVLLLKVEEYQVGKDQVIFTKESITTSEDMSEIFK